MSDRSNTQTLIVIDVQNDFTPGGSLEVPDGDQIIPVINKLQKDFDLIVATQDWHPYNHSSFASNHKGKEVFEAIAWNGGTQTLWPDHCVQGSEGADLHPELDIRRIEAIFRKGADPEIDSYSGFYDNGHKKSTGLAGYLREKQVKEVYCCGLAADICVYFTMKDALKEGFKTTLIEDAARPLNPDKYQKLKQDLVKSGARIIQSDAILAK